MDILVELAQNSPVLPVNSKTYEPCHEKTMFFPDAKTKGQISCVFTVQLIGQLVGPGQKPRRQVFS